MGVLCFEKRKNVFTWLCLPISLISCLIVFQVIIFIMKPVVEKRQTMSSIQIPIHNIVTVPPYNITVASASDQPPSNRIPIPMPSEGELPLSISDVLDEASVLDVVRTIQPTAINMLLPVLLFPAQPLIDIYLILEQSIGTNILQQPEKNPLRNCAPTVQFQLHATIKKINDMDTIEYTMQAMMMDQQSKRIVPKRLGGDEVYVEWVSPTTPSEMGVAMITDQKNGTYSLKFVRPPIVQRDYAERHHDEHGRISMEQNGRLTIYYDYTCGIGSFFAPKKNPYRRAGEVHLSFANSDVPKPYIHDFVPPNTDGLMDVRERKIDLSKYRTVIAFGDSLMLQFVRQYKAGGFWSHNIRYEQNINQCLSNANDTALALQKFNQWHHQQIVDASAEVNHSVAVIVGSAVWDAMRGCVRADFIDHRNAIRQFITTLRNLYPHISLYWKSPSAIVLHRHAPLEEMIEDKVWLGRSRYISFGVPRKIYTVQKALMQELNVPFLDLFDAYYLSGQWSLPGDSRHFQDDVSFLMLSYYWPGLNQTKVYYKTKS